MSRMEWWRNRFAPVTDEASVQMTTDVCEWALALWDRNDWCDGPLDDGAMADALDELLAEEEEIDGH